MDPKPGGVKSALLQGLDFHTYTIIIHLSFMLTSRLVVELSHYTEAIIPTLKQVVVKLWATNVPTETMSDKTDGGHLPEGHLHVLPRVRPGDFLIAYPAIAKESCYN